jgi:hypothetical protein
MVYRALVEIKGQGESERMFRSSSLVASTSYPSS